MYYAEKKLKELEAKLGRRATQKDLDDAGWEWYSAAWERGYVSRKSGPGDRFAKVSGDGRVYVSCPSWESSQYCERRYYR